MTDASLALRGAAFALLSGDADLVALTGAQRIHDGAPRGAAFPHLVIGAIESRPLLALAEDGEEQPLKVLSVTEITSAAPPEEETGEATAVRGRG